MAAHGLNLKMKSRLLPAAGLVFGSGLCALLYQTTWLREFRLVFGSTTAASAAVLGIFMAGLGAGSALLGRRAECQSRPLAFYAKLEFLIAASAALTPALIWIIRSIYVALGGTLAMGDIGGTTVRLLLTTVVLGTPTFLMGGTLPAMARFGVSKKDNSRRGLALLYGMNTLGAVAGAAFGTFYLFERFGNHVTLWLACLANALVALLALHLARNEPAQPPHVRTENENRGAAAPFRLILWAAAITGFVFLLMELVWFRMLSPILGGTTFTLGLILAVALAGIGSGGVAYSIFGGRRTPTLNAFALTCALEALFIALPYAFGDRLALAAMLLQPLGTLGFYGRIIAWTSLCSIVVAPAAFVAGIQFPILLGLLGKGRDEVASQTGLAYAWNTAGAIAGSLAGGFGFIPLFTATGTWRLVVFILTFCAAVAAVLGQRQIGKSFRAVPSLFAGAAAICLVLFTLGPTGAWRHSQLGVGMLKKYEGTPNQMHDFLNAMRRDILWETDGRETSLGISKGDGLAFNVNGKCDGNTLGDAGTQVMSGLLGALFHPHPTRAAVVGLGTGSTAGWLAAIPSMERVDVMELEPAITKFAAQCAPVNHNALANPKLHILYGDAREMLLTNKETYDLIVSEPSNPYRAGVATLFTREYYLAVARKLNRGGNFVQWMQAYDVDLRTLQIFYATITSVFPHIQTWRTQEGDLLLIASAEPASYDIPALRQRITEEPFQSALAAVWRVTDLEGVFGHYLGNDKLPRVITRGPGSELNTDNQTLLEFAFARNMRAVDSNGFAVVRQDAHIFEADQPPTTGGELDWAKVEHQRLGIFSAAGYEPGHATTSSPELTLLASALRSFEDAHFDDALDDWKRLKREPETLTEMTMVAQCLAEQGNEAAHPYIMKLEKTNPGEAQAIKARLLWSQRHFVEAGEILLQALETFHTNPWTPQELTERTLKLAEEIALAEKKKIVARQLFQALEKPLAVHASDEVRMMSYLHVGMAIDGDTMGEYTYHGVRANEPFIPWQQNFLKIRNGCYAKHDQPLASRAKSDLAAYMRDDTNFSGGKSVPEIAPRNRLAAAEGQ